MLEGSIGATAARSDPEARRPWISARQARRQVTARTRRPRLRSSGGYDRMERGTLRSSPSFARSRPRSVTTWQLRNVRNSTTLQRARARLQICRFEPRCVCPSRGGNCIAHRPLAAQIVARAVPRDACFSITYGPSSGPPAALSRVQSHACASAPRLLQDRGRRTSASRPSCSGS